MIGDIVIARGFGNRPYVRRVITVSSSMVYISNEQEYQRFIAGQDAIPPVGIRYEDVFQYDAEIMTDLEKNFRKPSAWELLKLWKGDSG